MVSDSIVCFETSGTAGLLLGTGSPKVPFGTVNPLQEPRFGGESSGHWAQDTFQNLKIVDPILQTAIFDRDLNFPILTCRTTSQPINLKNAQHFPLLFISTSGMYPILIGCGVYPIRQWLGFYAPQLRATPIRVVADVWENDVWEFQAKSGSSGSCCFFLSFKKKLEKKADRNYQFLSQNLVQLCCTSYLDQVLTKPFWHFGAIFPFFAKGAETTNS